MQTPPDREPERSADTFRELVEPYRRELQLHCYRMLGSVSDAEDVLQETLLAAWRGFGGFEGRSSLRTWLYRIATNRCLNAIRDASRRAPPEPAPPFRPPEPTRRGESTWLTPYPDALLDGLPERAPGPDVRYETREAVELAFVAALQRMPPRQATTLILRDVLGFPAAEVAALLGSTETAVKGALQRARAAVVTGRVPVTAPGSAAEQRLTRRFAEAFTAADVDAVVALLTDDAWLSMPPAPHEYRGVAAIAGFLRASATFNGTARIDLVPARANTQPAFGVYLGGAPAGLVVLTVAGDRIAALARFHTIGLMSRFGLPDHP
ncbi:RNA polymerase subunit sigma-70 [Actinoplanes sp. NPDC024001]|uniref:RNA polymerase subunit sigma-70 n=1 Tax=Actinoplanes sp. NPDC024001 TaxID=3154598 RepID=UPI0033C4BE20